MNIKRIAVMALAVTMSVAAVDPALAKHRSPHHNIFETGFVSFVNHMFDAKPVHHRRHHHIVRAKPAYTPVRHVRSVPRPNMVRTAMHGECGVASWYGPTGHLTASGAPMHPGAMEVAHKSLPFGTHIRITNKDNGSVITATVVDRGPFIRGRIVDLTRAAATRLGVHGLGNVCIEQL